MSEVATKVCRFCEKDVSGEARIKDKKGRYACQPCFERLKAKRASESAPSPPKQVAGSMFDEDIDTASIALALEASAPVQTKACPSCDAAMGVGDVFCVNCGTNTQTGGRAGKVKLKKAKQHRSKPARERRRASKEPASGEEAFVIVVSIAIVAATFFGSRASMDGGSALLLTSSFLSFALFALVVGITLLVVSFRDGGVIHFLLVLLVPLYGLYWAMWRSSRLVRNSTLLVVFTGLAMAASIALNAMWLTEGWVEQGSISGIGNRR